MKLVHADVRNNGYFAALCRDMERQGVMPHRIPVTTTTVTTDVPVVTLEKSKRSVMLEKSMGETGRMKRYFVVNEIIHPTFPEFTQEVGSYQEGLDTLKILAGLLQVKGFELDWLNNHEFELYLPKTRDTLAWYRLVEKHEITSELA